MQTETHLPHSRVLRDWQKVKAAPQGTTVYASFVLSGSGLGKPKRPPSLAGEGNAGEKGHCLKETAKTIVGPPGLKSSDVDPTNTFRSLSTVLWGRVDSLARRWSPLQIDAEVVFVLSVS